MSNAEEEFALKSDFNDLVERVDKLDKKVDDGFLDMRRNQSRIETNIMELRREVSHHSEILAEHGQQLTRLEQGQDELRQGLVETRNIVQQILEIVSRK